jgi:hypothetical protein
MKILILLLLASTASDAYYTHRNLSTGGRESNPIVRPFVQSTRSQVLFFSADIGATLAFSHLLRKHHHSHLGEALMLEEITAHSAGAAFSAAHPNGAAK